MSSRFNDMHIYYGLMMVVMFFDDMAWLNIQAEWHLYYIIKVGGILGEISWHWWMFFWWYLHFRSLICQSFLTCLLLICIIFGKFSCDVVILLADQNREVGDNNMYIYYHFYEAIKFSDISWHWWMSIMWFYGGTYIFGLWSVNHSWHVYYSFA